MTDSGWDIPGVPRDVPPGDDAADELAAPSAGPAGSGPRRTSPDGRRRSRMPRPVSSVSALSGASAGAFARSADSGGLSQADLSSPLISLARRCPICVRGRRGSPSDGSLRGVGAGVLVRRGAGGPVCGAGLLAQRIRPRGRRACRLIACGRWRWPSRGRPRRTRGCWRRSACPAAVWPGTGTGRRGCG